MEQVDVFNSLNMKIIIVDVYGHIRSTGKITSLQYKYLKSFGHDVRVCYRGVREPKINNIEYIKIAGALEPYFGALLTRLTGLEGYGHLIATCHLINFTKAFKPDVVQLNILHGYFINSSHYIQYLRESGIPVVYTMLDEYAYMGKCPYSFSCNQFMTACTGNCPEKRSYPKSLFFDQSGRLFDDKKKAYKGFDNIVFTGPGWVVKRAKESALLKGKRIEILDEPIDLESCFFPHKTDKLRSKLGINENKKIIVTVAQMSNPRKGGKYFYDVAKLLENREDLHFVYIGCDTKEPYKLENLTSIPFIESQELLAEYYSLGDLFICTSLADTMPNVCLEAMGCGTPLAGFSEAGTPYVCTEEYGRFTPTYDVRALADIIIRSQRKNDAIIKKVRDYAVNRYSAKNIMRKLEKIYVSLLNYNDDSI